MIQWQTAPIFVSKKNTWILLLETLHLLAVNDAHSTIVHQWNTYIYLLYVYRSTKNGIYDRSKSIWFQFFNFIICIFDKMTDKCCQWLIFSMNFTHEIKQLTPFLEYSINWMSWTYCYNFFSCYFTLNPLGIVFLLNNTLKNLKIVNQLCVKTMSRLLALLI